MTFTVLRVCSIYQFYVHLFSREMLHTLSIPMLFGMDTRPLKATSPEKTLTEWKSRVTFRETCMPARG